MDQHLQPFEAYDERSLIETHGIKAANQPCDLSHPPQNTGRAVRVRGVFTWLMFALATAYRLLCDPEATGGEPVRWRWWWRQILEQSRHQVIVFAQKW